MQHTPLPRAYTLVVVMHDPTYPFNVFQHLHNYKEKFSRKEINQILTNSRRWENRFLSSSICNRKGLIKNKESNQYDVIKTIFVNMV